MKTIAPESLTEQREIEVRQLWDGILDILLERVNAKSIPIVELRHVVVEVKMILHASRGRGAGWASVMDVVAVLLEGDAMIQNLRSKLPYNESTIYRALNRLEAAGIVVPVAGETQARVWMLNKSLCPVLFRASRPA